jgi:hypothetical protein
MNEHFLRGYWLTGGVKFMRTQYAPETNERLLGSMPKAFRSLLTDIQPAQWYARAHHVDLLNAIVSAHRDEVSASESLQAYGQLVATDASNGVLRPLMQIMTPKLLAKKLPNWWANDHQHDGVLEADIAQVDDARLSLKLTALEGYAHVGVVTLGWIKGLLRALGRRDVVVKQTGWSLGQPAPNEMTCEVRWS